MGVVSELRRRSVLRMAVLYVVAAWVVMQVVEVLISVIGLPTRLGLAKVRTHYGETSNYISYYFRLRPEYAGNKTCAFMHSDSRNQISPRLKPSSRHIVVVNRMH